ncbi:hypothetical protein [Paenibacillus brevis]|uniref:DUF3679 domain-containing protein n=1 Tax=Paenibacillus brevis TaxID=2841508 RepID=A0ABS6FQE8_9BACL|nr:hypothetical protein [Paenibacillus brevis]MBU5672396.1 hypothetical protein [Paenibacillus brevis]
MGKSLKKTLLYVLLLAAGVTLGMQISEPVSPGPQGSETTTVPENGSGLQQADHAAANPIKEVYTFITPDGKTGYFMVPGQTDSAQGEADSLLPSAAEEIAEGLQTPADLLLPDPKAPAVDRFADKTASLLQQLSSKSIHWVSSWFDSGE